jgi:hypothetical protein
VIVRHRYSFENGRLRQHGSSVASIDRACKPLAAPNWPGARAGR